MRAQVDPAVYKKILVLDATTGQNSLAEAEVFHAAVGIDSIVLSKCDSTAKGDDHSLRQLHVPFSYMGMGKAFDSLAILDPQSYLDSLFGAS